ncbi:MAG: hypothetical protein JXA03_02955, partial [Bacteroidales bacterium]|nr:hypothetical protein [Bacteroidales bacterium]
MKKILQPVLCMVFFTGTTLYCQNSFIKWINSPEDEYFYDIICLQEKEAYIMNIIRGEFETNPNSYSAWTKYRNIIYRADQ